ncbi:MAG TPA: MlaD family protein [Rudaea sp.]|nr:MlaD family protein [Rudaea sp.]
MDETPRDPLADLPAPAERRVPRFAPSLIWLVPLVAAITGAVLLIGNWRAAGPRITISFQSAEGVEAGKTQVRYKEVVIGRVTAVALSADNSRVEVQVDLDARAHGFAVADARYWVVRPRIGLGGVSGLGTLFSGAYIGADAGTSGVQRKEFSGLETPPAVLHGNQGRSFALHSEDLGSLDIGSPVYFRRVRVGRITGYKLDEDGRGVGLQLFVDAPYDRYVTASTHFWNASGIDLALTAGGMKLNTESLATVIAGGVAFQQVDGEDASASEAPENASFQLFRDRGDALKPADGPSIVVRMHFNETLRGLTVGSPVDFRGIVIGNVTGIDLDYEPKTQTFPANVTATVYPKRLGGINLHFPGAEGSRDDPGAVFQALVEHGFRAQARLGSLLTQQLYISLALVPNARPVRFDATARPLELPTATGGLEEIQQQVSDILAKLDKVPFDEIGVNLRDTLHTTNALMRRLDDELAPEAKQMLAAAQRALEAANRTLASDSPVEQGVAGTLDELRRAAQSLRGLADYLQRHPEALLRGKPREAPPPAGER